MIETFLRNIAPANFWVIHMFILLQIGRANKHCEFIILARDITWVVVRAFVVHFVSFWRNWQVWSRKCLKLAVCTSKSKKTPRTQWSGVPWRVVRNRFTLAVLRAQDAALRQRRRITLVEALREVLLAIHETIHHILVVTICKTQRWILDRTVLVPAEA